MKAILLAAGFGTRLRPLTDDLPKCLIPINGEPLIYVWLDLLENENVEEVLINCHYLPDKVQDAIKKRNNKIKIELIYEKQLLGSGGTLKANRNFVNDQENFYLLYADNLTNVSLKDLLHFHLQNKGIFTTYVYETDIPKEKGIFLANESGNAIEFKEKPLYPKSNLANSGIGVLNSKIFDYFPKEHTFDFGKDVMPGIVNSTYILKTSFYIKDIGTLSDYDQALKEWKKINKL